MSFICHIHNYTEYNEQWNVFSAFNPSKWSSGQPTLRRPGSSWGFGALLKGLTSVVDTSCQSRDSNPQPWVTSGFKSNALSIRPWLPPVLCIYPIRSAYAPGAVGSHCTAPGEQLGVQCLAQGHFSLNSCRPETRTCELQATGPTL